MKAYKELFINNLQSLRKDIESYENEEDLWRLESDIKNTPANLCLHLCGNLKHNFGAVLGNSSYVRTRDQEFSRKGVSKEDLLKEIDGTVKMITPVLDNLKEEDINNPFPNDFFGEGQTIGSVITRLGGHLGYHMGQINYHRRLLTK